MKKYLYIAIAAATLASCSQDEVMEMSQEAIVFSNAFVGNSSRAAAKDNSYGSNTDNGNTALTSFQVWGSVKSTGTTPVDVEVFKDVTVGGQVGEGSTWTTQGVTQYWIAGATYSFAAVVNADDKDASADKYESNVTLGTNLLPASITYTADGTKDLLFADKLSVTSAVGKVEMNFSHLLSKVKFSAVNETNDPNYKFNIKNIFIKNAYGTGIYYAQKVESNNAGTWAGTGTFETEFNNIENVAYGNEVFECALEKLLIPGDFSTSGLSVEYDFEWVYKGNVISTSDHKTALAKVNLEAGKAYNFQIKASINNPIQFTVTAAPSWTNVDTPVTVQ